MWHDFDRAEIADRHRLRIPAAEPAEMAEQIMLRAQNGSLIYKP
jgi:hypothetical protein